MMKCDMDLRPEFFENVVVSGGSSAMSGFYYIMKEGTKIHSPKNCKPKLHCPEYRKFLAWVGGTVLSSLIAGCVPERERKHPKLEGLSIVGIQQIDRVVEET